MNCGLDITITARPFEFSGRAFPFLNEPSSTVEKPKSNFQSEMVNSKGVDVNAEYLPGGKLIAPRGNTRHPSERWPKWELVFMEKCFEKTEYPSQLLRTKWALILTKKKLRTIKSSPESKENLIKVLLPHYEGRVDSWFKNRRALRQGSEASVKEDREGFEDDRESPVASPASHKPINHSKTAVQRSTIRKDHDYQKGCYDSEEFREDSPESEEGQSVADELEHDTVTVPANTLSDDEVFCNESRLDILARLASLQQPLPQPISTNPNESMCASVIDNEERSHSTLLRPTYRVGSLAKYDDDVILGATLLMQLKTGNRWSE